MIRNLKRYRRTAGSFPGKTNSPLMWMFLKMWKPKRFLTEVNRQSRPTAILKITSPTPEDIRLKRLKRMPAMQQEKMPVLQKRYITAQNLQTAMCRPTAGLPVTRDMSPRVPLRCAWC